MKKHPETCKCMGTGRWILGIINGQEISIECPFNNEEPIKTPIDKWTPAKIGSNYIKEIRTFIKEYSDHMEGCNYLYGYECKCNYQKNLKKVLSHLSYLDMERKFLYVVTIVIFTILIVALFFS